MPRVLRQHFLSKPLGEEKFDLDAAGGDVLYAFSDLAKEVAWDRDILGELNFEQEDGTLSKCDNDGVLIQSTKMVNHSVAKHFRIAQGFIRDMTKQKLIAPTRVASVDNQSDILTKPLRKLLFEKHRLSIMGPQQSPSG